MTNSINDSTSNVQVRPTAPADLDFILAAENDSENKQYIFQWPAEKHLAALSNPDIGHLVVETTGPESRLVGYAIASGLQNPHRSLELMRFVITEKGQGFGKGALEEIKKLSFEEWKAHRLWLDVIDHNVRAQGLYSAVGFQREGVLREAYFREGQPLTVVIMSILAQEYFEKPHA